MKRLQPCLLALALVTLALPTAVQAQEDAACHAAGACIEDSDCTINTIDDLVACFRGCEDQLPEEHKEIVVAYTDCIEFQALDCPDEQCLFDRCGVEFIAWERCKLDERGRLCEPAIDDDCACVNPLSAEVCEGTEETCVCAFDDGGGTNNGGTNNGGDNNGEDDGGGNNVGANDDGANDSGSGGTSCAVTRAHSTATGWGALLVLGLAWLAVGVRRR